MGKTKEKKTYHSHLPLPIKGGIIALALATVVLFLYLAFLAYYYQRIFPGVQIASFKVRGQTPATAQANLLVAFRQQAQQPLILKYQDQTFNLNLGDASPFLDLGPTVVQAYKVGRSGNYLLDLKQQLWASFQGLTFTPQLSFKKEELLDLQLQKIDLIVSTDPQDAKITLGETITVTPSSPGQKLDQKLFKKQIVDYLSLKTTPPIAIPTTTTSPAFTTATAQKYQQALEALKAKPLTLTYQNSSWVIDQKVLFNLLKFKDATIPSSLVEQNSSSKLTDPESWGSNMSEGSEITLDSAKVSEFLKSAAKQIDQEAKDAKFSAEAAPDGQIKVREFQSAQEGRKLDIDQTSSLITQNIFNPSSISITLPVVVTQPKITNGDVNNLGINQLIGKGVSSFSGSITNRIYNIGLAASRINGLLIPPGVTFSFLEAVGDISATTGYKQAYVIKSGRTVLDDGGGVCQVSTTVFRAALNTGLPITDRTAHAYRVSYYEQGGFQPGLDATVFYPSVDLKFKNDTTSYILIQAYITGQNLTVDLYGTSDGRISTISTPKILSQTPPLPEMRQDDPTLPKGEVKQVDWPAWGAKVTFSRTVTRGSETLISETFDSNYRPWQAVYLVGTKE